ncbi:hypothetical protein ASPWEDRAFT_44347 [Aspergillus wentii DTO 134E9]|uniref:Uncharacterized protein n=1 Tax=Aspergillus wentii DTO 134E9 TaxID=1073089 RepID=A0A1L9RBF6_ASPWE|nr:uncharacterized protein ASPWEDRAFT_44347 [Aspergillus wentii DTO 134E9]OJJ32255.1 hypothetical protein ASPWEDRAFT_44347 [Aspergillus wentii DTO 134E9]
MGEERNESRLLLKGIYSHQAIALCGHHLDVANNPNTPNNPSLKVSSFGKSGFTSDTAKYRML